MTDLLTSLASYQMRRNAPPRCPTALLVILLFTASWLPRRTWFVCRTASLTQCVAGGIWLKNWADKNTAAGGNPDVGKYLGIYFVFGIGAAALTVLQTLILWIFCSIEVRGDQFRGPGRGLTCGSHRHLASYTRGWRRQSSDRPCPFSTLHQLAAF